jgi:hypothetical protein
MRILDPSEWGGPLTHAEIDHERVEAGEGACLLICV